MLFIYLYHGDLYSDLWKRDLYFSSAGRRRTMQPQLASNVFAHNFLVK